MEKGNCDCDIENISKELFIHNQSPIMLWSISHEIYRSTKLFVFGKIGRLQRLTTKFLFQLSLDE